MNKKARKRPAGAISMDHAAEDPKFPYVVMRVMATVSMMYSVQFTTAPGPHESGKTIFVTHPKPWRGGKLTASARAALLNIVQKQVNESSYLRCVVFGPRDSIYLEPNHEPKQSKDIPGGGIVIKEEPVIDRQ